jgi:hypothetical protein
VTYKISNPITPTLSGRGADQGVGFDALALATSELDKSFLGHVETAYPISLFYATTV